jgi:hypothetical protein
MKCRLSSLVYPLLIFLITGPACSLTSSLAARFGEAGEPSPTRPRRYVVLPPALATASVSSQAGPTAVPGLAEVSLPESAAPPITPNPAGNAATAPGSTSEALAPTPVDLSNLPVAEAPGPVISPTLMPTPAAPIRPLRPTATPTPDNFAKLFAELLNMFNEPTVTPTDALRLAMLPTIPPTPTDTATPTSTLTPIPTDTPTATPIPLPTDTSTPIPTNTPVPAPVSAPVQAPAPAAVAESSLTSPVATPEPESGYDFLLAEFYNSPTTNSFLVFYVAIVDPNEIPIGDMKIVGTRLDHNLTYESPLSTWHYEGYNAPGEVIKSGNVKFEPPGGIETTDWILYLEDAHGNRQSEDVPLNTNQNDKQWYFIKFKRRS